MGFVFRLERVLSVRCIQEDAAQAKHARAQQALRAAQAELSELQQTLQAAQEDLDHLKHRDELTSDALYLHSLHAAGLRRQIQRARSVHAKAAAEVERTGSELLEAHRAREALETLREREEASWRQEQARREAKDIDELATSRHRAHEEEDHGP